MKQKSKEPRAGRTQKTGDTVLTKGKTSEDPEIKSGSGKRARQILEQYLSDFQTDLDKLNAIKTGLKSKAIAHFIELADTNQSNVAQLLSLSEPTLRKYINESRPLNTGLSEHLLELFELYEKGIDTFGSVGEYRNWLSHYNIGIERTPLELLDTITGIRIVKDELVRIDHGVLA